MSWQLINFRLLQTKLLPYDEFVTLVKGTDEERISEAVDHPNVRLQSKHQGERTYK